MAEMQDRVVVLFLSGISKHRGRSTVNDEGSWGAKDW